MRIVPALLTVVLISSAVLARPLPPPPIKPAKEGPPIEESLKYINEHLYNSQDEPDSKCNDRLQLSVSDDHNELILKHLLIDKKGRARDNIAPKYIYYVPVATVSDIYTSGPWTVKDRVVVMTAGRWVKKYGPVWDCEHDEMSKMPHKHYLASIDIKTLETGEESVNRVAKALKHVVELLQDEQKAKAAAQQPKSDEPEKKDSDAGHK